MAKIRNRAPMLEQPLTARSVIASLLLGMHPPRMPGSRLVRWCGVFGIAEGTARVALSRMVDRGELVSARGAYELAGAVRSRQTVQEWSLAPKLRAWSGTWSLGAVATGARTAADRSALREAMRRLHYAESREGLWVRPDNLPRAAGPVAAWEVADAQCEWWRAIPDEDATALVTRLFDPHSWAERAATLRDGLVSATDALGGAEDTALAHGFETGAAVLAHVRADPLLPPALCPDSWPGDSLRSAYRQFEPAFGRAVREWFRQAA
jgi:phenylacetic acid degradation operon negative regulatory protein